jgi:exodeoxyribonuclease-5
MDRRVFDDEIELDNGNVKDMIAYELFEYGYSITCHLAQGSQYNTVIVKYEPVGGMRHRQRWLYTAVTRAINKLTLII